MNAVLNVIGYILEIYVVVLVLRALLSWFPARPGTAFARLVDFLDSLTEPVLRPVRQLLPPVRAGGIGIDLSILLLVIVLQVVAGIFIGR